MVLFISDMIIIALPYFPSVISIITNSGTTIAHI